MTRLITLEGDARNDITVDLSFGKNINLSDFLGTELYSFKDILDTNPQLYANKKFVAFAHNAEKENVLLGDDGLVYGKIESDETLNGYDDEYVLLGAFEPDELGKGFKFKMPKFKFKMPKIKNPFKKKKKGFAAVSSNIGKGLTGLGNQYINAWKTVGKTYIKGVSGLAKGIGKGLTGLGKGIGKSLSMNTILGKKKPKLFGKMGGNAEQLMDFMEQKQAAEAQQQEEPAQEEAQEETQQQEEPAQEEVSQEETQETESNQDDSEQQDTETYQDNSQEDTVSNQQNSEEDTQMEDQNEELGFDFSSLIGTGAKIAGKGGASNQEYIGLATTAATAVNPIAGAIVGVAGTAFSASEAQRAAKKEKNKALAGRVFNYLANNQTKKVKVAKAKPVTPKAKAIVAPRAVTSKKPISKSPSISRPNVGKASDGLDAAKEIGLPDYGTPTDTKANDKPPYILYAAGAGALLLMMTLGKSKGK
jgi:hypothetical protein